MPERWQFNEVETAWTFWAALMLPRAFYGLREAWLDLQAARQRNGRRAPQRVIAAWWWLSAAALFVCTFAGNLLVGLVSGTQPNRPVETAAGDIPASTISALAFFAEMAAATVCLEFGLWARRQLAAPPRRGRAAERRRREPEE